MLDFFPNESCGLRLNFMIKCADLVFFSNAYVFFLFLLKTALISVLEKEDVLMARVNV